MDAMPAIVWAASAFLTATLPAGAGAACSAASGAQTAGLVELYTSEGCSSCPPAERTLARLGAAPQGGRDWITLAWHVDYWDYIGWRDPYAQPAFTERQRWLVQANGHSTVYTPHVFVNGVESDSQEDALRGELSELRARKADADIHLDVAKGSAGALQLTASAQARAQPDPLALYVAVTENHLVSKVMRGENGGATLTHEHVVRDWMGPFPLVDGAAQVRRELSAADAGRFSRGELVAFVQDQKSGRVLQSLGLPACQP
jgi:hypothetical protein